MSKHRHLNQGWRIDLIAGPDLDAAIYGLSRLFDSTETETVRQPNCMVPMCDCAPSKGFANMHPTEAKDDKCVKCGHFVRWDKRLTTRSPRCKIKVHGLGVFDSATEAAKQVGVTKSTLSCALKKGHNAGGYKVERVYT